MNKWCKIERNYFDVDSLAAQLTIGSHANLDIKLNTVKNPDSYNYFTNWFDLSTVTSASEYKKEISTKEFDAKGCFIKSIDIDPKLNVLSVVVACDYLEPANVSERREKKIDDILHQTSKNKLI